MNIKPKRKANDRPVAFVLLTGTKLHIHGAHFYICCLRSTKHILLHFCETFIWYYMDSNQREKQILYGSVVPQTFSEFARDIVSYFSLYLQNIVRDLTADRTMVCFFVLCNYLPWHTDFQVEELCLDFLCALSTADHMSSESTHICEAARRSIVVQ